MLLFDGQRDGGVLQIDGVVCDFRGGLIALQTLLVGMAHIQREGGGRNIDAQLLAFANDKGMLIEEKIYFDFCIWRICIAEVGYLIDIIP